MQQEIDHVAVSPGGCANYLSADESAAGVCAGVLNGVGCQGWAVEGGSSGSLRADFGADESPTSWLAHVSQFRPD
eukprot:13101981-Alexandrium_andersonii.AAC.1